MNIKPLDKKNIRQAIKLGLKTFPWAHKGDEPLALCLKASLKPDKYIDELKEMKISSLKYYVISDDSNIIGLTGLYSYAKDDTYWIGWTCVDESYRGKGLGKKLMRYIIRKSKRDEKRFLKLYTSNERSPIAVQMYKKLGFKLKSKSRIKISKNNTYDRLVMELEL